MPKLEELVPTGNFEDIGGFYTQTEVVANQHIVDQNKKLVEKEKLQKDLDEKPYNTGVHGTVAQDRGLSQTPVSTRKTTCFPGTYGYNNPKRVRLGEQPETDSVIAPGGSLVSIIRVFQLS